MSGSTRRAGMSEAKGCGSHDREGRRISNQGAVREKMRQTSCAFQYGRGIYPRSRLAGIQPAMPPTAPRTSTAVRSVPKSLGPIPNKSVATKFESHRLAARPRTTPDITRTATRDSTSLRIPKGAAPIARRMPISCRRPTECEERHRVQVLQGPNRKEARASRAHHRPTLQRTREHEAAVERKSRSDVRREQSW